MEKKPYVYAQLKVTIANKAEPGLRSMTWTFGKKGGLGLGAMTVLTFEKLALMFEEIADAETLNADIAKLQRYFGDVNFTEEAVGEDNEKR